MTTSLAPRMRRQWVGAALVLVIMLAPLLAPALAPNDPERQFSGLLHAPPTSLHVVDVAGSWHAPFFYGWRRVSQLEQRYAVDRDAAVPVRWFDDGRLLTSSD